MPSSKTSCTWISCIAVAAMIIQMQTTAAQEQADTLFPKDSEAWLNSPPISMETLKNKAAILYFFEER